MPYLPEALASLENQTFRDFELLLWDNGSVDGTVEEARRWIPSRLPGRVVAHNPLPLHECLAKMVVESKTKYVARMDGDDICYPERFELQHQALEHSEMTGIVGGQCCYIDQNGVPLPLIETLPQKHEDIVTQMLSRSAMTHPALMFRREVVISAGNYTRPKPVEDLDLYMRMSSQCHFMNLSATVLKYRIHPTSVCRSNVEDQARQVIEVVSTYSETVYGMASVQYQNLQSKQCACAICVLVISAARRARWRPGLFFQIIYSRAFLSTARWLTGQRDYLSKTLLRALEASLLLKINRP